ncbi:MAG TPA: glycosyltransferase family 39 protein [Phototrophicaceae bacterium]|nr:glycosyltransferase family 39 protein [Phototrophicaceae bacterium]
MKRTLWLAFFAVLLVALIGRALLLASGTVSFHSDEAIVGLMARHILQGERPTFFYGQAYMGSLDSWLIALGFTVLGDSVLTMRIVESILYLLIVASGFAVAWRISERVIVAVVAALMLAIPNVLLAVYSTATLGGYNETLLFGNLILLLAWDVTHEQRRSLWRWAALGLCIGVGWWTNGLVIAFVMPAAVLILWDLWRNVRVHRRAPLQATGDADRAGLRPAPTNAYDAVGAGFKPALTNPNDGVPIAMYVLFFALILIFFVMGSAPWWSFNLQNDWAALRFYLPALPSHTVNTFAGTDIAPLPTDQRLIGLFLLGLPAVIGLRFPWMPGFFLPIIGLLVLLIYAFAFYNLLRGRCALKPPGRLLLISMVLLFCGLFIVSRFSIDPTGRYFLPLTLPLGIVLGTLIDSLRRVILKIALVVIVIGYQFVGLVTAVATVPPGLTTQFNLETHIPNTDDQALIAFLDTHQLYHGYTNYWVSFRLAFLSADRMQYSAVLPYKTDLSYTPFDNRYPPYIAATDHAPDDQIAYITANVVAVRQKLEAIFAQRGVTYQESDVGVYHVYYDFQPRVPRPPLVFK